jgi:hypothetical protein
MVTLERSVVGGSKVVWLEMERGVGDKSFAALEIRSCVSKFRPIKGLLIASEIGIGSVTEQ